jgi:hypothetical protein
MAHHLTDKERREEAEIKLVLNNAYAREDEGWKVYYTDKYNWHIITNLKTRLQRELIYNRLGLTDFLQWSVVDITGKRKVFTTYSEAIQIFISEYNEHLQKAIEEYKAKF